MPNPENAMEWVAFARKDHEEAVLLKAHGFDPDRIAIHLQQMMEKSLKALLVWNRRSVPRVHDLTMLLQEVGEMLEETERYARSCARLSQLYFTARYPMPVPIEVSVDDVVRMMADAEALYQEVEALISKTKD